MKLIAPPEIGLAKIVLQEFGSCRLVDAWTGVVWSADGVMLNWTPPSASGLTADTAAGAGTGFIA